MLMRRPAAHRQRVQKVLMALLLMPLAGLVLWLLFFPVAGPEQGAEVAAGRASVEGATPLRGNIYDRNFEPLALSFRLSSLYARPLEITNPEETATALARILNLDQVELLESFRSERGFVWLARQVEKEVVDQVLEGNFSGVHLMPRSYRHYPHGAEAAHVVGFVKDEQGLAGIELAYDNMLRGGVTDAWLAAAGVGERGGEGGKAHLVSTLDLGLQRTLEQRLQRAMRVVAGRSAAALLMDVNSGAILAMASLPGYDPNRFWSYSTEERTNLAVIPHLQVGELWEIFRLAASLDQGRAGVQAVVDEELLSRLGLCGPTELDLLEGGRGGELDAIDLLGLPGGQGAKCRYLTAEGRRARVSGVSLLAAVSRLVNGGQPVYPHLVMGVWDWAQLRPLSREGEGVGFPPPAGGDLLAGLAGLEQVVAGETVITIESLVVAEPEGLAIDPEQPRSYQATLLGLAPARQPSLALLMFIDQARIDPAMPSPLAGMARELPAWSKTLPRVGAPPPAATAAQREAALYRRWLAGQEAADFAETATGSPTAERMPNVMGLSMRKALQSLQVSGLRFRVHGSGWVVAQHPAPGTLLKGGEEGIIELRAGDLGAANGGRR
ncbi:PASTA domain-containing protein [Desulfurivibrio sp. D14AmB]|uniref:PASTA domain-containing protein n=1 Tax=Desulfurivibrio sp. D14AmB TaxID=3374370 RepID=UPI00376F390E